MLHDWLVTVWCSMIWVYCMYTCLNGCSLFWLYFGHDLVCFCSGRHDYCFAWGCRLLWCVALQPVISGWCAWRPWLYLMIDFALHPCFEWQVWMHGLIWYMLNVWLQCYFCWIVNCIAACCGSMDMLHGMHWLSFFVGSWKNGMNSLTKGGFGGKWGKQRVMDFDDEKWAIGIWLDFRIVKGGQFTLVNWLIK